MSQSTASDERRRTGARAAASAWAVAARPLAQALRPAAAGNATAVMAWASADPGDVLPAWRAMYPAPAGEGAQ